MLELWIGCIHFFSIIISDRLYYLTASLELNESFDFGYFLIFPDKFLMGFLYALGKPCSIAKWENIKKMKRYFFIL